MKYSEYFKIIREINIKESNLLFWNLWCLNYVFEKIEDTGYKHYNTLKESYLSLWKYNDKEISSEELFEQKAIKKIFEISDDDYNDLDDFNISEKAIKELIGGLEIVILGLKENNLRDNAIYNYPINVIDIILDCKNEDKSPLFLNEANAQIKLAKELSTKEVHYNISDKNIYRN